MKRKTAPNTVPKTAPKKVLHLHRRTFIKTLSSAASALLLPMNFATKNDGRLAEEALPSKLSNKNSSQRPVFIFQDQAHFDTLGINDKQENYVPPTAMASTRDYINQTDDVLLLKRHWFV